MNTKTGAFLGLLAIALLALPTVTASPVRNLALTSPHEATMQRADVTCSNWQPGCTSIRSPATSVPSVLPKDPTATKDPQVAACMLAPELFEVCLALLDAGLIYCDNVHNKWARWACYAALVIL